MYKTFWKALFIPLCCFVLFTNIVFTFDLVQMINPSALQLLDEGDAYSNYYFGMSSFIDAWTSWFGDKYSSGASTFLWRFNDFLLDTGEWVSSMFTKNGILSAMKTARGADYRGELIAAVIMMCMLFVSGAPVLLLVLYGCLWILYLLMFAFYVVLFIFAFMGGVFRTPLPSTDWWNDPTIPPVYQSLALLV